LIDNKCQTCVVNAGWNGESCVCISGYFMIGSACLTCDINSFYSPSLKDCVCNRGFYGNRTLCQKCHSSCGKCTGPNANQCVDCIDVSYTLSNGSCTQTSKCIAGLYLSGSECQPCMPYCINCNDGASCNTCANGFTYVKT
jgi:proprotein convertase subtilisin/kexin type 5